MYKIEAVVKFNQHEALVLNESPEITYERYGNALLGLDKYGIFCNSYEYETPSKGWEAFAGRKFDIHMADGTVEKAYGQWWDGGTQIFIATLGCSIINVTANEIERLKRCFVFTGYRAVEEEYDKLRETYTGKVYEYWEYDCELTGSCWQWEKDKRNPKNMVGTSGGARAGKSIGSQ
ncbi:hypothetical protein LCGC14_1413340 [marine sediment metagenome]|uniref:Uncharacterized protein n=1 Tax=marine sediment metagenome TaxID=412755 RepID=A0A0F9MV90_9ZZZZ|nr:hypothetical protein [Candidatus Aminicenantes bacterium]